jgi:hypothetical protein
VLTGPEEGREQLIDCFIGQKAELYYFGRTLAGLYELPHMAVKLRRVDWIQSSVCALDADGLKIAIDLSDHSDLWDIPLLEWCDVYAKRDINPLHSTALQYKIIPYGLNYACHSRRGLVAAMAAIAGASPSVSKAKLHEMYCILATPHWKFDEYRPQQPVDNTILFQARVWEPHDAPGDEAINEERIALLLALKREFGSRVVGGVVPTPFARKTYPEFITNQPCRQPQYIRWAKRPLIGIYFRGLFGSIGFKMAEYIAASKCIVSEPIDNLLPAPLDHISVYRSVSECLEACDHLLSDASLAQFQRQQSWKYYEAHVAPRAHMASLLARARAVHDRREVNS